MPDRPVGRHHSIIVGADDLRFLLFCSIRYATGRRSYAPSYVQEIVKSHRRILSPQNLTQIADELDRESDLGSDFDRSGWLKFAEWCRSEADKEAP